MAKRVSKKLFQVVKRLQRDYNLILVKSSDGNHIDNAVHATELI
jgi:hypothetical protein